MSKYCTMCGRKLEGNALFCESCGAKQEAVDSPAVRQLEEDVNVDEGRAVSAPIFRPVISNHAVNKSKRSIKPVVLLVSIVAVICSIAMLVIFFWGRNKGLVAVEKMEQMIDEAYIKALGAYDKNYEGVKQFELKDVDEKTHDQTFNCFVMPSEDGITGLRVTGLVKDGQVIQLQSIYIGMEDGFNQFDTETQAAFMAMVLYPISIFKEDVDTVQEFANFLSNMEVVGDDPSEFELRSIEGNNEYTYMGGLGNGVTMLSFNVRYLPAFSSGFFEDDGDDSLSGKSSFQNSGNSNVNTGDNTLDNFLDQASGIWVDLTTCKSLSFDDTDVSFLFCGIVEGKIYTAAYPGGGSRVGKIVDVIKKDDSKYILTLFYPEEESMGDFYEEEYITCELILDGKSFFFEDYPETIYTYMGNNLDNARKAAIKYCKQ